MEEKVDDIKVRFDMKRAKSEQGVEYRLVQEKQQMEWRA